MKLFRKILLSLVAGVMTIGVNALDLPTKKINGREFYYYAVERGESLLSIAADLGISREQIVEHNPGAADGVRQGSTLFFPVSDFKDVESPKNNKKKNKKTEKKEKQSKKSSFLQQAINESNNRKDSTPEIGHEFNDVTSLFGDEHVKIALMLPLMLDENIDDNKSANSATEFLRGFLIGVNEYKDCGLNLDIHVIDTKGSAKVVAQEMKNGVMGDVDILVAPDDTESIQAAAKAFRSPNGYIYNVFAVQDSTHYTNSHVVQTNVHNTVMYKKAVDALLEEYAEYTPVFLISKNGRNEKINFTNYLRDRLSELGINAIDMTFTSMLTAEDFKGLDQSQRYVFIPGSGSINEFSKFARALVAHRESLDDPDKIALFGYPDWTTFRNESLEHLHNLDATIYSRFYADDNYDAVAFAEKYKYYYGTEMPEQVPSQALLGWDLAKHIIHGFAEGAEEYTPLHRSEGLQSSFHCAGNNQEMAGYANQAVYIIKFHKDANVCFDVR